MTVKQLIKKLEKLSPDSRVSVEGGFNIAVKSEVTPYGQRYVAIKNKDISELTRTKLLIIEDEIDILKKVNND